MCLNYCAKLKSTKRRMYSTPTFTKKFKYHYKSNKNSSDLHTNKGSKKKKSYEHMYKHLPIKAF